MNPKVRVRRDVSERHGAQIVALSRVSPEHRRQALAALLVKIAPDVCHRKIAFRPCGRKVGPDVVPELFLAESQRIKPVAIPSPDGLEDGAGNGLRRAVGVGKRRLCRAGCASQNP